VIAELVDFVTARQRLAIHPIWCEQFSNSKPSACMDADEDYQELHCRGSRSIAARDGVTRKPVDISVDLFCGVFQGEAEGPLIELTVPGGHADLNRAQLRQLIAELKHIDDLWEM
jgi:hypothetical protein